MPFVWVARYVKIITSQKVEGSHMRRTLLRSIYQNLNAIYNGLAEVREEDFPYVKETKQSILNAMREISNELDREWTGEDYTHDYR
jgi:hypothetical protein